MERLNTTGDADYLTFLGQVETDFWTWNEMEEDVRNSKLP